VSRPETLRTSRTSLQRRASVARLSFYRRSRRGSCSAGQGVVSVRSGSGRRSDESAERAGLSRGADTRALCEYDRGTAPRSERTASLLIATTARTASSHLGIRLLGPGRLPSAVQPRLGKCAPTALARVPDFAPDHVLVGFDAGTPRTIERLTRSVHRRARADTGRRRVRICFNPRLGVWLSTVEALRQHADVRYAEPDWVLSADQIPNDQGLGNQWDLLNTGQTIGVNQDTTISGAPGADIKATAAWDVTTGTAWDPVTNPAAPVVGVVDTGLLQPPGSGHKHVGGSAAIRLQVRLHRQRRHSPYRHDLSGELARLGFDPSPLRPLRPRSAPLARDDRQRSDRGKGEQLDRHRGSQLERTVDGLALGPERLPVRVYVRGDRGDRLRGAGKADLGQRQPERRDRSTYPERERARPQQLVRLLLPGRHRHGETPL
jgi:hypothetical protein